MAVVALKPRREYSFTGHATSNPSTPPPGDRIDGEVDRIHAAIGQLIDFLSVSLNPDGTLKPGSVGRPQLLSGLFDKVAETASAQLQPLLDAARTSVAEARTAASEAASSAQALHAQTTQATAVAAEVNAGLEQAAAQTAAAQGAASSAAEAASRATSAAASVEAAASSVKAAQELLSSAAVDARAAVAAAVRGSLREATANATSGATAAALASATAAENAARRVSGIAAALRDAWSQGPSADPQDLANLLDAAADAQDAAASAAAAAASAAAAANSANHADGVEAVVTDYGLLTQAWAEHMPDVIPPGILATMDVTGDHWSSRWWANRAAQIVGNQGSVISNPNPGDVVVMGPNDSAIYVDNADTLAALTIWLPLVSGGARTVQIGFRSPVTSLTILTGAGAAIVGAPINAYGPGAAIIMRFDTPGWVYWK